MASLAPAATVEGRAEVAGWELFVNIHGVLSIRPGRPEHRVLGLVWRCSEAELDAIDRFEAVDVGLYQRGRLEVVGPRGQVWPTFVYRSTSTSVGRPRPGYLEQSVLPPMRELGFPRPYVSAVEDWLAAGTAGPPWAAVVEPVQRFDRQR
jgi:gamma-glutamylcyclotransferase (GGCT)/AIG2-like uncharacterized protein YtfP